MKNIVSIYKNQEILINNLNINNYIININKFPLLNIDDEYKIIKYFKKTLDIRAANVLIITHLRFVVRISKYYIKYGLLINDLIQEGSIGLIKSIKKYDIKESMKEIELDIMEGCDMSIVKPGLPYLDIIYNASKNFNIPIIAYQVSGEYSMLKYAVMNKIVSENAILESIISFKRAGASAIISYFAKDIAEKIIKS